MSKRKKYGVAPGKGFMDPEHTFIEIKVVEPIGKGKRILGKFFGEIDQSANYFRYIYQKFGLSLPKNFFEVIETGDKDSKKRKKRT